MEEQVIAIYAGVNGFVDGVAVKDITRLEAGLMAAIRDKGQDILIAIRTEQEISDATGEKLKTFIGDFVAAFE